MSKIEDILEGYLNYYISTRQVGHTTTMLNGAKSNSDSLVVVANEIMGRYIRENHDSNYITYCNINNLKGRNAPIVFDNAALHMIFSDVLIELNYLKRVNEKLGTENEKLVKDVKYFSNLSETSSRKLVNIRKLLNE